MFDADGGPDGPDGPGGRRSGSPLRLELPSVSPAGAGGGGGGGGDGTSFDGYDKSAVNSLLHNLNHHQPLQRSGLRK